MSTVAPARNPLLELLAQGQSVWYDYIRRSMITSGELARLIAADGLRGITSNPSIWEKAIAGSTDYDDSIEALRRVGETDPQAVYERLAIQDIQEAAAEVLSAALYERFSSRGEAGFADQLLSALRSEFGGHAEHHD